MLAIIASHEATMVIYRQAKNLPRSKRKVIVRGDLDSFGPFGLGEESSSEPRQTVSDSASVLVYGHLLGGNLRLFFLI